MDFLQSPPLFSLQPKLYSCSPCTHLLAFLDLLKLGLRKELSCLWRWLTAQAAALHLSLSSDSSLAFLASMHTCASLGCFQLSPGPQAACLPFPPLPQTVASRCPSVLPGGPDSGPTGGRRVASLHGGRRLKAGYDLGRERERILILEARARKVLVVTC